MNKPVVPYNFVRLPNRVAVNDEITRNISGEIDVEITTRSPLYIRGPMTPKMHAELARRPNDGVGAVWDREFRDLADFAHQGNPDDPIIPGSAVRGMLRTIFAILTSSNLPQTTTRPFFYRTIGEKSDARTSIGEAYKDEMVPYGEYPAGQREYTNDILDGDIFAGYLVRKAGRYWIRPSQSLGQNLASPAARSFTRISAKYHGEAFRRIGPVLQRVHVRPGWVGENNRLSYSLAEEASIDAENGLTPGWAVVTSKVGGRGHLFPVVFDPDHEADLIEVPPDVWAAYEYDCGPIHNRSGDAQGRLLINETVPAHDVVFDPIDPDRRTVCPVFYRVAESDAGDEEQWRVDALGGVLFFRLPYKTNLSDLRNRRHPTWDDQVDQYQELTGDRDKAERYKDLFVRKFNASEPGDHSEQLFGTLLGYSSRVSVSSFRLAEEASNPFLIEAPWTDASGYTAPQPLLAPKPMAVQLYLEQDPGGLGLTHFDSLDATPGFKLYWHWGPIELGFYAARHLMTRPEEVAQDQKRLRTIIRPIRQGITFTGTVRFTDVSEKELGALLTAIDPAIEGMDPCHHLGGARPLGFGSVKTELAGLRVKAAKTSLFEVRDDRIQTLRNEVDAHDEIGRLRAIFHKKSLGLDGKPEDLARAFWAQPSMQDLAHLLHFPDRPQAIIPPGIEGPEAAQWAERWPLPRAAEYR